MTTDKPTTNVPLRTLQVIVQAERLVADLERHTDMLRRLIEEERRHDTTHGG